MKSIGQNTRLQRMTTILALADRLNVKIPATVTEKRGREEKLQDLVRPISNEEIVASTVETVDELVERVRVNASYQTPSAIGELARLETALQLDLYETVKNNVFHIYNDAASKLDKLFAKTNVTAAKVPYAFAADATTWEHYDNDTRNALTALRKQSAELIGLGTLLDRISEEFFQPLAAPEEIAILGSLQPFYDFGGFDSPTLAQFKLPEAGSLDITTITYLAERGVNLRAQKIGERLATERALITQAQGYGQRDDGVLVPFAELSEFPQGVAMAPAYVDSSVGEVAASPLTLYAQKK